MNGTASAPVLILGGTTEARLLAERLDVLGVPAVTSLAGRTDRPQVPPGVIRSGGFGGPAALAAWLREHRTLAVVDASHPFAVNISRAAATACAAASVPLLRIERPAWTPQAGDRWHRVDDLQTAAHLVPTLGRRILLTIGRQGVHHFADVSACWFLIRCVERPANLLPAHQAVLLARGPFALPDELALIDRHAIDVLVTKDSGGEATGAKLEAARQRGLPVVVVNRPVANLAGMPHSIAPHVEAAVTWVQAALRATPR